MARKNRQLRFFHHQGRERTGFEMMIPFPVHQSMVHRDGLVGAQTEETAGYMA